MVKLGAGFARQFGRSEILVPHANNWFARGIFPDEIPIIVRPNKERDDAFHPSGDPLTCARTLYAKRREDIPYEKPSLESQKSFMLGHFFHGMIYHIVQDLGFSQAEDIEYEVDTAKSHPDAPVRIRGHIDVVSCTIPGESEPIQVDVKSQAAMQYAKLDTQSSLYEKYQAQVKMYLWLKGMSKAIIFWAEKDTPHRFKETTVLKDDHFVEEVLERWHLVVEHEALGTPPDCTCGDPKCIGVKTYL